MVLASKVMEICMMDEGITPATRSEPFIRRVLTWTSKAELKRRMLKR